MNDRTAQYLNALNAAFYARHAASFDDTRQSAWAGWERLTPHLKPGMHVWDAGCGNGRFARFLADRLGTAFHYHGTDSSPDLLARARAALADMPGVSFARHDLLTDPLPDAVFDLIALFGVLHHVPGAVRRAGLVRALADRLTPGGLLVFTSWRFDAYPRFRARIVPWAAVDAGFPLDLEPGDHLLDWQHEAGTPRYCHAVDDAEHAALIAASGLTPIDGYRADGFDGALNQYAVLRRNSSPA
jgi:SAM-dependent methyltransferase